jgi:hypothetical protein
MASRSNFSAKVSSFSILYLDILSVKLNSLYQSSPVERKYFFLTLTGFIHKFNLLPHLQLSGGTEREIYKCYKILLLDGEGFRMRYYKIHK